MPLLIQWLPTIVAVITAALALGGANSQLREISADLAETRAEYKALALHVQDVLTAKAITALHVDTIRAAILSLQVAREEDTKARHQMREEFHRLHAQSEAQINDLRRQIGK